MPDDPSDKSALEAIPTGWRSRFGATRRIVWQVGRRGAASMFGMGAGADQRLGDALLKELDQLKGMAMKVGQILSYMDVGVPEEVSVRLAQLRKGVTPLDPEIIREVLEGCLGRPRDELFRHFDPEPMAAASIGQVHRAATPQGDDVAVKVRYPGVRESLQADFRQLARLGELASVFAAVDGSALVRELHARVDEECDYGREADWQRRFRTLFEGDPAIHIPRVYDALSCDAVLTTEFVHALDFEAFRASCSPEARDAAAVALVRFAFEPLFARGFLHADPHPGNQLYSPGGALTALDFGCVRAFDDAFVERYRRFCRSLLSNQRDAFRDLAIELGLAPRPERIDFEAMWDQYEWLFEPVSEPHFQFGEPWWRRGLTFTRPGATNARHQGVPPEFIWLQRVQWGLWAVLKRLGSRADLTGAFEHALQQALP